MKWVCHLKTVTRNTYPILNSLLERIGRRDLIACLAELGAKTSKSPKVIREVRTDDPEYVDEVFEYFSFVSLIYSLAASEWQYS